MDVPRERSQIFSSTGLAGWNAYFLAKFVLVWKELIGFHPIENLAFAAALLIPIESPAWRRARGIAAWPVGAALLYYDSWLPPVRRVLAQANLLADFSVAYLVELLGRFVSVPVVAALALTVAAYLILSRWLRFSVLVTATLVVLAIRGGAAPAELSAGSASAHAAQAPNDQEAALQRFFADEASRSVDMRAPSAGAAPFDVIFLQVCSLSWDDLRATGLDAHPLWQRFDILLTRFNSASAYSGPAAIRILRATCGQSTHNDLYNPAPPQCYLMGSLQRAGFAPALALNHDGHFDDFLKFVQAQGGADVAPLPLDGLKAAQHAFDGSPVYEDGEVLGRWLDARARLPAPRVALFYNTVSLHDGNKVSGEPSAASLDTYRERLKRLLDDIDGFMQAIERSGRRAVVVMVPEHGAAIRGDRMQIAGLREIPSPAITLVPVGVKVIGAQAHRNGPAARVDAATSYLAVSEIVARMLDRSPFGSGFSAADYAEALPTTPFVAQNEGAVVMESGGRYFLKLGQDGWSAYAADAP